MDFLNSILNGLKSMVVNVLPTSPFRPFINNFTGVIAPYIGMVNWFIPVGWILTTLSVWLTAIAIFYLYQIVLRWLGAID